jgi:hypothetical protein
MRRIQAILVAVGFAGLLVGSMALRTVSSPPARPTAQSTEITWIGVGRFGGVSLTITGHYSDGSTQDFVVLEQDGSPAQCGGVRINATTGAFEQFMATTPSTCGSDVTNTFRTTTGTVATRLDAVETLLAGSSPPRLP